MHGGIIRSQLSMDNLEVISIVRSKPTNKARRTVDTMTVRRLDRVTLRWKRCREHRSLDSLKI